MEFQELVNITKFLWGISKNVCKSRCLIVWDLLCGVRPSFHPRRCKTSSVGQSADLLISRL